MLNIPKVPKNALLDREATAYNHMQWLGVFQIPMEQIHSHITLTCVVSEII